MSREAIPTWTYVLVVVRLGHRFLVLREKKHGQLWYLPAGRVELSETLQEAAIRETLEETGVPIVLEGILRIEHSPLPDSNRMRAIFVARPADDTSPISEPNDHALEARWVSLKELNELPVRARDMVNIFRAIADGATVYPLSMLTYENEPFSFK